MPQNSGQSVPLFRVATRTNVGKKRSRNEDRAARLSSPHGEVLLLADGMGGHRGGARAAEMVVDGMERSLLEAPPATPLELTLQVAAQKTNADIFSAGHEGDPELHD